MQRNGEQEAGQTTPVRQVAGASLLGTTIEWYDFFLYVTAVPLVFNQVFFPEFEPLVGTLLGYSTNAVAFVARPIGGAVFGHFGDRIGRKSMLIVTLLLMGIATFAIGCLPTYSQIGVAAPLILIVLRFVQGMGLGGEWGGAVLMSVEHSPEGRRGFFGSFPQMGIPAGVILSSLIFLVLTASLSNEQFLAWGWRVPFLLSILLVGVGLYIRFYILIAFTVAYGTEQLGLSRPFMVSIVVISSVVSFFLLPAFALLSDRFGRRPLLLTGTVGMAVMAFVLFPLLDTRSYPLMLLGHLLVTVFQSMNLGPIATFFVELFETRVRYTGATMGYQAGTIIAGGSALIIATYLLDLTGSGLSIAAYIAVMCVLSFVAIYAGAETYQLDIEEEM